MNLSQTLKKSNNTIDNEKVKALVNEYSKLTEKEKFEFLKAIGTLKVKFSLGEVDIDFYC